MRAHARVAASCPAPFLTHATPLPRALDAGAFDAASKLWAEGGIKRFSAGLAPCLARSFPANAAGFAIYEATKTYMQEALA
jgi:hypothetical protein